jgi:hypothetical protein
MKKIRAKSEKNLNTGMQEMAERFAAAHEEEKETEAHKKYLLGLLNL